MFFIIRFITFFSLFISLRLCSNDSESKYVIDNLAQNYGETIYSSVIFRHGARNIAYDFPNNPYPAETWKNFMQLTQTGKQEIWNLGQWFRKRYYEFMELKKGYDFNTVKMISTDSDRALMSAELFLAGMYPPTAEEMWNNNELKWQPIPVHPLSSDLSLIIEHEFVCPRYNSDWWTMTSSEEAQVFYTQYQDLIEFACFSAGFSRENCSKDNVFDSANMILIIRDTLAIENSFGMKLPEWALKILSNSKYIDIATYYLASLTYSQTMKRIRGGMILRHLIDDMKLKREGNYTKKLNLLSAHDSVIVHVLNTLGVYNYLIPNYASSVIFELRQRDTQYFVTLLYRNSTQEPPVFLEIPGCKNPCTLDKFIEATKDMVPENLQEECEMAISAFSATYFPIIIIIIIIIAVCLLGAGIYIFANNFEISVRNSRKMMYSEMY